MATNYLNPALYSGTPWPEEMTAQKRKTPMANLTDLLAYQLGALEAAAKALLRRIDDDGGFVICDSVEYDHMRAILARQPEDWQRLIDEARRKSP